MQNTSNINKLIKAVSHPIGGTIIRLLEGVEYLSLDNIHRMIKTAKSELKSWLKKLEDNYVIKSTKVTGEKFYKINNETIELIDNIVNISNGYKFS